LYYCRPIVKNPRAIDTVEKVYGLLITRRLSIGLLIIGRLVTWTIGHRTKP